MIRRGVKGVLPGEVGEAIVLDTVLKFPLDLDVDFFAVAKPDSAQDGAPHSAPTPPFLPGGLEEWGGDCGGSSGGGNPSPCPPQQQGPCSPIHSNLIEIESKAIAKLKRSHTTLVKGHTYLG